MEKQLEGERQTATRGHLEQKQRLLLFLWSVLGVRGQSPQCRSDL